MTHWTTRVYRLNGHLFHDVEGAIFRNDALTAFELQALRRCATEMGTGIGTPILDLACGPGRHALRLASQGLPVTGIDLSETFLGIARRAADQIDANGQRPRLACGDMRRLPTRDGFYRTVILLGNSFGYFPESQNLVILREVYRTLSPGGFFCMELTDREVYLPIYQACETERIDSRAYGTIESRWTKTWDAATQRLRTFESHRRQATGEVLFEGSYDLRLYDRDEIGGLLAEAGFGEVTCRSASPRRLQLEEGLGETLGAAGEVLFVGALK